jgi:type II secretory ATPase GspE/PulE/Tfp pilus assembly ATPase PilB-like protein
MKGEGCEKCGGTGYRGRCGVYEVADISQRIRQMIFVGESTDAIRREAVRGGMRTLRQDALTKVLEGISTVEELLRVTPNESQE